ncbi:MAG: hypothetical protein JO214_12350 [Frankiaceae bacterium]|nr:hypothetical protein [Frankiaceae bacterium]
MTRVPVASALTLSALTLVLAGCGGGHSPASQSATPRLTPASLDTGAPACDPAALPAGFVADGSHSGRVTAQTYSPAVQVQAALEYDQLQSGVRDVYLHHVGGTKSRVDAVIDCTALQFPSVDQANRFFGSFRALRHGARAVVTKLNAAPKVTGLTGTVAYLERKQSFQGYGISSTNVVEAAGLDGTTLRVVSISGRKPATSAASDLLQSAVSAR